MITSRRRERGGRTPLTLPRGLWRRFVLSASLALLAKMRFISGVVQRLQPLRTIEPPKSIIIPFALTCSLLLPAACPLLPPPVPYLPSALPLAFCCRDRPDSYPTSQLLRIYLLPPLACLVTPLVLSLGLSRSLLFL
jgi:hypothetical protein